MRSMKATKKKCRQQSDFTMISPRSLGTYPNIFTYLLALSLVAFSGCNEDTITMDENPSTSNTKTTQTSDEEANSVGEEKQITFHDHQQSFTVESLEIKEFSRPVHILWAIDNSLAMDDEISALKTHIKSFIRSIEEYSPLKVTIISATQGERSFNMSVLKEFGVHMVSFRVTPETTLGVLIKYLVPTLTLEDQRYLGAPTIYADDRLPETITNHPSSDFFRAPSALKILMVLTHQGAWSGGKNPLYNNNDSRSQRFLSVLKQKYGSFSLYRFYGFLNFKAQTHYVERRRGDLNIFYTDGNAAYREIMAELGGNQWHSSNISSEKWQENLQSAQTSIIQEVRQNSETAKKRKAVFTLDHPASEILEVKVNNFVLSAEKYHSVEKKLHIDVNWVRVGDQVEVKYKSSEAAKKPS